MNFAGLFGLMGGVGVFLYTINASSKNAKIFLDPHALMIVGGGTIAVALLCFPFRRLYNALKVVTSGILGKQSSDYHSLINTIVTTTNAYRKNPKTTLAQIPENAHPFFNEGMQMLVEYGFNQDDLNNILLNSNEGKRKRDQDDIKVWHTISRFPPAFGLLGATVGMISLLQTLGEPGAQDRVGPAMATALVATFYGLIIANLVLIPISEKLSEVAKQDRIMRNMIREGVLMIQEKRHPLLIAEYLYSFLEIDDRQPRIEDDEDMAA